MTRRVMKAADDLVPHILIALAIAVLWATACVLASRVSVAEHDVWSCEEDMSCWNCETMGNHRCGPTSTTNVTTSVVV